MITFVFVNYKRPDNLKQIIAQLRQYKYDKEIFVWNNGEVTDFDADWVIDSSRNIMCWPRWYIGSIAKTEYVCLMDEDLTFKDEGVVPDAIAYLNKQSENCIIGPYGVQLIPDKTYQQSIHLRTNPNDNQDADIIKGRMSFMRTKALGKLSFIPHADRKIVISEDIIAGAILSDRQKRFHKVPTLFYDRIIDLPAPFPSCGSPDHYEKREESRRLFFTW